jgi:ubiquinone/menaquinone biosynthesis C-methylase UbiE
MTTEDIKSRVRDQFAGAGDAYVKSVGHATGNDLQRMLEVTAPRADEVLLDLATGGGHVARVFAPHVRHVIASDLTPEILSHAEAYFRELEIANFETLVADAEAIPLPDASVDIVTCRIAPHHFPDPRQFVEESARVLRRGGRFVLIDSTVEPGAPGIFFNAFEKKRDPSHVRSLTLDEWLALIVDSGLTVNLHETFHKRHDFADWTSRSRMTPEDRADLEQIMLDAPEDVRAAHQAEIENGSLRAFVDTKTLFLATKP